jgi:hypothetical protein
MIAQTASFRIDREWSRALCEGRMLRVLMGSPLTFERDQNFPRFVCQRMIFRLAPDVLQQTHADCAFYQCERWLGILVGGGREL